MQTTKRAVVNGKEEVVLHPKVAQLILSINKRLAKSNEELRKASKALDKLFRLMTKEDSELDD